LSYNFRLGRERFAQVDWAIRMDIKRITAYAGLILLFAGLLLIVAQMTYVVGLGVMVIGLVLVLVGNGINIFNPRQNSN
jgi:hypothetical protein